MGEQKKCRRCGNPYFWPKGTKVPHGVAMCHACFRKMYANWRALNLERIRNYKRDSYATLRDREPAKFKALNRRVALKRRGATQEWYDAKFKKQHGECAICGQPETAVYKKTGLVMNLSIDHDHETNELRGLLCMACNVALHRGIRSESWFKSAGEYLKLYARKGD